MIDVAHTADADYAISVTDIMQCERQHGMLQPCSFVLGYTGWGKRWNDAKNYRNVDAAGTMHFPKFSPDAVALLLDRRIVGLGIDTLSPDAGDTNFPVHKLVLENDLYIVENVRYDEQLPATGMMVMIAPLRIEGATESPVRMVAMKR